MKGRGRARSLVCTKGYKRVESAVSTKPCSEKMDLASAYDQAARKYSEAVAALNKNIGTCAKDRYDVFFRSAEQARQNVATARECLAKHIDKHRC